MAFIDIVTQNGVLAYPYVLGLIALLFAFVFKDAVIVQRHGLQILAMALLLPILMTAANKGWVSNDAFVAILSTIVGYVFGSGSAAVAGRKEPSA